MEETILLIWNHSVIGNPLSQITYPIFQLTLPLKANTALLYVLFWDTFIEILAFDRNKANAWYQFRALIFLKIL